MVPLWFTVISQSQPWRSASTSAITGAPDPYLLIVWDHTPFGMIAPACRSRAQQTVLQRLTALWAAVFLYCRHHRFNIGFKLILRVVWRSVKQSAHPIERSQRRRPFGPTRLTIGKDQRKCAQDTIEIGAAEDLFPLHGGQSIQL